MLLLKREIRKHALGHRDKKGTLGSSFTADFISVTNLGQILFACVNLSSHSFGYQKLKPDMTKLKSPEPVLETGDWLQKIAMVHLSK